MYILKTVDRNGEVNITNFGVYTEAIVALCASINAGQIDETFYSVELKKQIEVERRIKNAEI